MVKGLTKAGRKALVRAVVMMRVARGLKAKALKMKIKKVKRRVRKAKRRRR